VGKFHQPTRLPENLVQTRFQLVLNGVIIRKNKANTFTVSEPEKG
jgi:hypothetical protein